mgnify:CR=1 FL=1
MFVSRVITLALKAAGILGQGQTASAAVTTDAFDALNAMIAQWSVKRGMVYELVDATTVCTGAKSYTVGPTGAFSFSTRPNLIDSAYVSLNYGTPSQVDLQLEIIEAREDWNRVSMKSIGVFPYVAFYDNAYPNGLLYAWPVPSAIYQLTITAKLPLVQFASTTQDINLPPEYQEALVWNLAARIRPLYQLEPDPSVMALARASLSTIRQANAQVPLLSMPSSVKKGGRFNVYSGQ